MHYTIDDTRCTTISSSRFILAKSNISPRRARVRQTGKNTLIDPVSLLYTRLLDKRPGDGLSISEGR